MNDPHEGQPGTDLATTSSDAPDPAGASKTGLVARAAGGVIDVSKGAGRGVLQVGKGAGKAGVKAVRGYWSGFAYAFKGAKFVYLKHPSLIRIWVWPIVITLACFVLVTLGVVFWHDDLLALAWARPTGEAWYVGWLLVPLWWVVRVLMLLLLLLVGLVFVYMLSSLFAAPFNDLLSEEVELLYKGVEGPKFSWNRFLSGLALTLRLELGKQVIFWLVMGPTFVLSLIIPVVGQIIYVVFGYFFTIVFFAVDYTDWPLARRGRGFRARMRLVRRYLARMMGLGTAVWLLLFIPILGLFFMPAGVAGGTLLVLDMEAEGELEEALR